MEPKSDTSEIDVERTFQYSRFLRVLFLAGAVFFLSCTVFAFRARPENGGGLAWPAVTFLGVGLLNCWLLRAVLPTIRTDASGVTSRQWGTTRQFLWRDIQRVEHRAISSSLMISTGLEEMRIQRQLIGFLSFVEIVAAKAPAGVVEPPFSVPFRVPASRNLRIVLGGMALFFVSAGCYTAVSRSGWGTALLLFAFAGTNTALLAWQALLRVEFEATAIHLVYPARRVSFHASVLEGVTLFQRDLDIVLLLHIGTAKPVEMSDSQFTIAPERIYASLIAAYGLAACDDSPRDASEKGV